MAACDPPEQDCSFIGRIKEMVGITVMDHELPLEVSAVVRLNELKREKLITGVDESVPVLEKVSDIAEAAELGAAALAGPTAGGSVPAMKVFGAVGAASDFANAGMQAMKAYATGGSYESALTKAGEATTTLVISGALQGVSKKVVKETGPAVANTAYRSSFTGRFVSNLYGYSAGYTAPAATTVALVKTIFGN
ncbi:MAG: hypothetical protein WC967_14315 [Balneolaceae bacterium]